MIKTLERQAWGYKHFAKIACILIIAVVLILIHNFFDPPDWVELHLVRVPPEVDAIYVVAREQGEVSPLKWYLSMVFPFLADPKMAGEQWYWTVSGDRRKGDVQWRSADAYGVLAHRESGDWVLWWLDARNNDGPSPLRYVLGGGEKITIRASGIESAEKAPKSLTDQVWQWEE
jgi:hypothetical protein